MEDHEWVIERMAEPVEQRLSKVAYTLQLAVVTGIEELLKPHGCDCAVTEMMDIYNQASEVLTMSGYPSRQITKEMLA